MSLREENIFMAKLSEDSERYKDMIEYMKIIISLGVELSIVERNLVSVAYKNVVGNLRQELRIMCQIKKIKEEEEYALDIHKKVIDDFIAKIKRELVPICHEVIDTLEKIITDI
eukprot:GHVL01037159.1.p1 GENE.GHVL01037159.1~~GHVL01037159.1.p1  ORF type:complete len:114 (+),score=20.86 GHVL01037159.1:135-476(+)